MALIPLFEAADPRLWSYRAIREPELAARFGLFVAEGRLIVERAIARAAHDVESILVSATAAEAMRGVFEMLPSEVPVYVASLPVLREVAGFNMHRGCVGLVRRPPAIQPRDLLMRTRTVVALESVSNPDNIGGVFRAGHALGADAVLLSADCSDPLYRKSIRTSMGAVLNLPYARFDASDAMVRELREAGFLTIALTTHADAHSISEAAATIDTQTRLALLVGAEGAGLRRETQYGADLRFRIPMTGGVDSLNLTVAAAIALSQLRRVAD